MIMIFLFCLFASSVSATATRQCAKSDVSCVDIQRNFAHFHDIFLNKFDAAPFSTLANCDYFFDGTNCYTFEGNRLYTATSSNPTNWYAVSTRVNPSVTVDPIAIAHYGIYDYQLLKAAGANNVRGFFQAVKKIRSKESKQSEGLGKVKPAILVAGKADSGTAATLDGDSGVCPTNYVARGAWKVESEKGYVKNKGATGCSYSSIAETGASAVNNRDRFWVVLCVHDEVDRVHQKPLFLSVNCPTGYDYFWVGDTSEGDTYYGSGNPTSSPKYFARGYDPSGNGRLLTPEQTSQQYNQRTTQRGLDKTGSNGVYEARDGIFLCLKNGLNVPGESSPKRMANYISLGAVVAGRVDCARDLKSMGFFGDRTIRSSYVAGLSAIRSDTFAALCVDDMPIEGPSIQMPECGKPPKLITPAFLRFGYDKRCPPPYEVLAVWDHPKDHSSLKAFVCGPTSYQGYRFPDGSDPCHNNLHSYTTCKRNTGFYTGVHQARHTVTLCVHEALTHKQFYPPAVFFSPFDDCGRTFYRGRDRNHIRRKAEASSSSQGAPLAGSLLDYDFSADNVNYILGGKIRDVKRHSNTRPENLEYFMRFLLMPNLDPVAWRNTRDGKPWALLDHYASSWFYYVAHGTLDRTGQDWLPFCTRQNIFPDLPVGQRDARDYIYWGHQGCHDPAAKIVGLVKDTGWAVGHSLKSGNSFGTNANAGQFAALCVKKMPIPGAQEDVHLGTCTLD
jgi:hypothetical protein